MLQNRALRWVRPLTQSDQSRRGKSKEQCDEKSRLWGGCRSIRGLIGHPNGNPGLQEDLANEK